ncbi:hypothetical protein AOQ84DRAFT_219389 [Glonium stellatum]|uniref:Uncharacterized protein n=1 Tax=Glonium stellatum TaxID=574774 RepID=A0A8E2EN40_9PEZI|nr:hypothetical protein AOQ84DRAFT_219389 [Glonium stellatum]
MQEAVGESLRLCIETTCRRSYLTSGFEEVGPPIRALRKDQTLAGCASSSGRAGTLAERSSKTLGSHPIRSDGDATTRTFSPCACVPSKTRTPLPHNALIVSGRYPFQQVVQEWGFPLGSACRSCLWSGSSQQNFAQQETHFPELKGTLAQLHCEVQKSDMPKGCGR